MIDILNQNTRYKLIQEIKGEENKQRKAESLKQFEIFHDRQHQYVIEYLRQQFSAKTVKEMPVISSVNLARRIVTQEASLYLTPPSREFSAGEAELEQIQKHYDDLNIDAKMLKANQVYKLQNQCLLMCIPKDGKLTLRVLYGHHYDVVADPENPEVALAYIISSFDKQFYLQQYSDTSVANPTGYRPASGAGNYRDNVNQGIGDPDDYKSSLERYVVWTKDYNFIMDGNGAIITPQEDIESPLKDMQVMPFVDLALDKDFEYFVRMGQAVTDFSVQYCGALSDLGNVVKMQGWAQAYLKGSKDMINPENIQIGPNFILKLPIDPNDKVETEFGFANPQPDLGGSISYVEMLLSNFLTSRGVSPKIVSGKGESEKYSSGVERLLSMIQKFEASKSDMELFKYAEKKLFDIIRAWNNAGLPSEVLDVSTQISDETTLNVKFHEPQAIQSKGEQLDSLMKEIELGLKSRVMAIKELYGVDEEKAQMIMNEIDQAEIGALRNGQAQGA